MRRRLFLAAGLCALIATTASAQSQIENLAAFARLYGVARWFYPSDAAASLDWNRFAVEGARRVREVRTAVELEATLKELFTPLGPGIEIGTSLPAAQSTGARDPALVAWYYRGAGITEMAGPYLAKRMNRISPAVQPLPGAPAPAAATVAVPADLVETPITGATFDVELALGLKARVPMSLTDTQARTELASLPVLRSALAGVASPRGRDDLDVRVADAIVAWNVFRHFYPYWGDVAVDWDARLRPLLKIAIDAASTRAAHLITLRMIVSELQDGHGGVRDIVAPTPRWTLPVQFRMIGEKLVVTASNDTAVAVGSVVASIDGVPASAYVGIETQLSSGTLQWRQVRAVSSLQSCQLGSFLRISLAQPDGSNLNARLACDRTVARPVEARPDSIVELEPGIWYVDLTRLRRAELLPRLDALAKARGVVFDLRGYPTDVGAAILPFLMRTAEDSTDHWMHVSRITGPFGQVAGWQSMSWSLRPAGPQVAGDRVFLTDGRAISYAESVMGHVRDHNLGTIIGSTTAGANGNIATFTVPGGFTFVFTGMRVTRHDNKSPYHTVGVSPNIPLEPTVAGLRAGRDELLERALLFLKEKR